MTREVERVQHLDEPRCGEREVLERLLPGQVRHALPAGDPAGVVEGEGPVRPEREPHRLVGADGGEDDRELRETVMACDEPSHA
ncbi:MAG TPA: hypothetical protein VH063_07000 [Gaiellaceae bacterium]|nr:hypothetical protein [Gaiellaceae bacterium]